MVDLDSRTSQRLLHLVPIVLVLLMGAGSYLLFSFSRTAYSRETQAAILRHDALLRARADITASYAMFERRLAGEQIQDAAVLHFCRQARESVADCIEGHSGISGMKSEPITDPSAIARFNRLVQSIDAFAEVTRRQLRWSRIGPHRPVDQAIAFHQTEREIQDVDDQVLMQIADSIRHGNHVQRLMTATWFGILAAVSVLVLAATRWKLRAEDALAASERRFRVLFSQAAVGIAEFDMQGRWLRVNKRVCDILGYSEEELQGKSFREVTHLDDLALDEAQTARLVSGAIDTYSIEKRYIRKDGQVVWVNLTCSTVRDEHARPGHVVAVIEDISVRRRTQDDRDRLLQAEQTARAQAEAAGHAKDRFVALVSHELRAPLSAIVPALDAISGEADMTPEGREMLEMIHRNVKLEVGLINDLLDLARVQEGKFSLKPERVDIHALVAQVFSMFKATVAQKQLTLQSELRATNSHTLADGVRVTQVLWNLIGNAVKFTPASGQIVLRTCNPDAQTLRIEVQDNGIGIEPDLMDRLFRPFEQAQGSVSRPHAGLGLGLALSRRLVEEHGGTLLASSKGQGKGSCFTITMPLAAVPQPAAAAPPAERSLHVLLVEDNADTLNVMASVLRRMGHQVTAAHNGSEALDLSEQGQFDVLVSDIGLPDFSGWELLRRLRSHRQIRAVAVSGFGADDDIQRSRDAGFDAHLVKPISVSRLRSVLGTSRSPASAGANVRFP